MRSINERRHIFLLFAAHFEQRSKSLNLWHTTSLMVLLLWNGQIKAHGGSIFVAIIHYHGFKPGTAFPCFISYKFTEKWRRLMLLNIILLLS